MIIKSLSYCFSFAVLYNVLLSSLSLRVASISLSPSLPLFLSFSPASTLKAIIKVMAQKSTFDLLWIRLEIEEVFAHHSSTENWHHRRRRRLWRQRRRLKPRRNSFPQREIFQRLKLYLKFVFNGNLCYFITLLMEYFCGLFSFNLKIDGLEILVLNGFNFNK